VHFPGAAVPDTIQKFHLAGVLLAHIAEIQLLTQSEILEKETSPPAKEAYHHSKAEPDEAKHGQDL
jgi:hypothetical protein